MGDEYTVFGDALRNENSIKWIMMDKGKSGQKIEMFYCNRQNSKMSFAAIRFKFVQGKGTK